MYSSLKTASVISIIFSVINAAAAVLIYMMLSPSADPITMVAIAAFMASTSIVLLITGFTLRNLHADMDTTIVSMNSYIVSLRKRIDALEKKS